MKALFASFAIAAFSIAGRLDAETLVSLQAVICDIDAAPTALVFYVSVDGQTSLLGHPMALVSQSGATQTAVVDDVVYQLTGEKLRVLRASGLSESECADVTQEFAAMGELSLADGSPLSASAKLLADQSAARAAVDQAALLAGKDSAVEAAERARLAEAAAAEALREKLKNSDAELTAMTLALEEQRKRAEETLTLLAATSSAAEDAAATVDQKAALLAAAQKTMAEKDTQIATLGEQLSAALAQVSIEQERCADLEPGK